MLQVQGTNERLEQQLAGEHTKLAAMEEDIQVCCLCTSRLLVEGLTTTGSRWAQTAAGQLGSIGHWDMIQNLLECPTANRMSLQSPSADPIIFLLTDGCQGCQGRCAPRDGGFSSSRAPERGVDLLEILATAVMQVWSSGAFAWCRGEMCRWDAPVGIWW